MALPMASDPPTPNKHAELFREMASRIEKNDTKEFGGAMLMVPPDGEPVVLLLTTPKPDTEGFWSMASAKVQIATQELMQTKAGGFGRR